MFCLECGKKIKALTEICPNCGYNQYGKDSEYKPTVEKYSELSYVYDKEKTLEKVNEPMFTEEQCFMMHIHPDDELYRKFMELDILSKNYD